MTDLNHNSVECLGQLLAYKRKSMGLSRAALAKLSSVPAVSIAKYEKAGEEGGQYPPVKRLAKLALALELDGNWVLATCLETEAEIERFQESKMGKNIVNVIGDIMASFLSSKIFSPAASIEETDKENKKPEESSLQTNSSGSNPASSQSDMKEKNGE